MHSRFERAAGELRAKFVSVSCGARGRRRGLAGHTRTAGTAGVDGAGGTRGHGRASRQGLAAVPVGGGGAWPGTPEPQALPVWREPEGPEGLAAAAVGGGGAWPGFETTRRAQLAARTASGRAAAHGRTKQPGPTAGSDGARNTSGATDTTTNTTKRAGTPRFRPALDAQRRSAARDNCRPRATRVSSARPPCRPCRSSRR